MASTSNEMRHNYSYVVVPRSEYENLYNRQYAELTTLKKKINPDGKRERATKKQP